MQKDFHYGVIKILALNAGFSETQAQIIAYSSQYVDDATEHKPMRIKQIPKIRTSRLNNHKFDPICTAHKGLQFIEDYKRSVQMKIYLCFHFLPDQPYSIGKEFSYLVRPDGMIARLLVQSALKMLKDTDNSIFSLIKLGVALHSYADTWAHQHFTGTHSHFENDLEHIEHYVNGKWVKIKSWKQLRNNIFPDIGHAEAYDFPDLPYKIWRYMKAKTGEFFTRRNPDVYLEAAKHIYDILCGYNRGCSNNNWIYLKSKLQTFFSYENRLLHERCDKLHSLFPEINFEYHDKIWKEQAVAIANIFNKNKPYPPNYSKDLKWFYFHMAADEQRKFVLSKIKPL